MNKILLTFFITTISINVFANERANSCEEKWHKIIPGYAVTGPGNYDKYLKDWLALKPDCEGTGVWEFRLGATHSRLGDFKQARKYFNKAISIKGEYQHMPELALIHLDMISIIKSPSMKTSDINIIEDRYKKFIEKHPKWPGGYEQAALLKVELGKYNEAIQLASIAVKLDSQSWGSYRSLVIAYHDLHEYKKSIDASKPAVKLKPELYADIPFMLSLAISYIKTGNINAAANVVSTLVKSDPSVQTNKRFLNVAGFIARKLIENGTIKE